MTAAKNSTRQMHVPTFDRPHCWTDPVQFRPESLTPRASWCWDRAAACGDARSEWHRERQITHTPQCHGCSRRIRAIGIDNGAITPHPSVKTGPMRDGGKVAA
jgi:hypothetical protein